MQDRDCMHFPCTKCGICCRNLEQHEWYSHLDRGNGTCIYLDTSNNQCRIYENRPDICRIDKYYDNYKQIMSESEYIDLQIAICHEKQVASGISDALLIRSERET